MSFELFDPKGDYSVRRGSLPHWYQPGVTYFVTYRTADSIPSDLLRMWHGRRDQWLRQHGLNPAASNWREKLQERAELADEYDRSFSRRFMEYLDQGHGACRLADPRIAEIIADNLQYSAGERYHLGDFVIMPNHVHLLVGLIGDTDIVSQCRSWKRFTATQINRLLGLRGRFWQEEAFDHLVRTPEHFDHFRRYIAQNPQQTKLSPGTFLHHVANV
jgi:type I restriction enzyme R subunit